MSKLLQSTGVECADYCNYCDQHFKHEDKEGLRKNTEKHCVNCEKLFSTQKSLNAHKTKCKASPRD